MRHLKSCHQSKEQEAMMGDRCVTVEIHQEEALVAVKTGSPQRSY